jgi:hypothetical protein
MPQSQTDAIAHGRGAAWPFAGVKPRESSKTPKDDETLTQPIAARFAPELSRPARD